MLRCIYPPRKTRARPDLVSGSKSSPLKVCHRFPTEMPAGGKLSRTSHAQPCWKSHGRLRAVSISDLPDGPRALPPLQHSRLHAPWGTWACCRMGCGRWGGPCAGLWCRRCSEDELDVDPALRARLAQAACVPRFAQPSCQRSARRVVLHRALSDAGRSWDRT